jgi:hypothetical protein
MISFLAQSPADPTSPWLVLGIPGLMVVGFLTGQIVTKLQLTRESTRADLYEAKYDALLTETQGQILPAIKQHTQTLTALVPVLERMVKVMEDERTTVPARRPSGRQTTGS